jgi:hypothetical protein
MRVRPYAQRLQQPYTRACQLGFRVSLSVRLMIQRLAQARQMSVSEYLARLLNDHLLAETKAQHE